MVKTISAGVRIPLDLYHLVMSCNKDKTFNDVIKDLLIEKFSFTTTCAQDKQNSVTPCAHDKNAEIRLGEILSQIPPPKPIKNADGSIRGTIGSLPVGIDKKDIDFEVDKLLSSCAQEKKKQGVEIKK